MSKHSLEIAVFQLSLFGINTYVVFDPETRDAAIIDPGMSTPEEEKALSNFISRESLNVTHIINTHLHIDHAIGNEYSVNMFKAPVYAHQEELPLGRGLAQQAKMFGMNKNPKDAEISEFLSDGDKIKIGNGELEVRHIPGHSPGSIVLYDKEDNFVIAGDVLFHGSIGRTDLPGGDYNTLISGIKSKLLPLPDETIVFSGHGEPTSIGEEKSHNPFLKTI